MSDAKSRRKVYNRCKPTPITIHQSRITTMDWAHFTPWTSLLGGVAIGIAAAMLVLLNGRIAGVSGILGGLLAPARGDIAWRVAFIAGLLFAPAVYQLAERLPAPTIEASYPLLAAGGTAGGRGHALRLRLHERPRGVRPVAPFAALARRDARVHARGFRDGVRRAASASLSDAMHALERIRRRLDLRSRTDRFRHGRSVQGDRLPGSRRASGIRRSPS